MKPEYRLVYRGQSGLSEKNRGVLVALLQQQFSVGKIFELDELMDNPPFILKSSPNRDELEEDSSRLRALGAETLIVRGSSSSKLLSHQIERESIRSKKESGKDFSRFYAKYLKNLQAVMQKINQQDVAQFTMDLIAARSRKSQIIVLGNGGSAAAASHFATDLSKQRFEDEGKLFRVLTLADNVPWLTATSNDFGYDQVFEQQLKNVLQPGDLLVVISSSGNSENVLRAVKYAHTKGASTYAIVGFDGGKLLALAQKAIHIPTKKGQYGFMEDATGIISHMVSIFLYEQDQERDPS